MPQRIIELDEDEEGNAIVTVKTPMPKGCIIFFIILAILGLIMSYAPSEEAHGIGRCYKNFWGTYVCD